MNRQWTQTPNLVLIIGFTTTPKSGHKFRFQHGNMENGMDYNDYTNMDTDQKGASIQPDLRFIPGWRWCYLKWIHFFSCQTNGSAFLCVQHLFFSDLYKFLKFSQFAIKHKVVCNMYMYIHTICIYIYIIIYIIIYIYVCMCVYIYNSYCYNMNLNGKTWEFPQCLDLWSTIFLFLCHPLTLIWSTTKRMVPYIFRPWPGTARQKKHPRKPTKKMG